MAVSRYSKRRLPDNVLDPIDLRGVRLLMLHTLIPKFTHINLQSEQCKNHQAEYRQRHHFGELLEAVQQRVDDSL